MVKLVQKILIDNYHPLTLDEVKGYLKIIDSYSDELLLKLIDAAILEFESYTGKVIRAYQAKFVKKGHFYKVKMPTKFVVQELQIVDQFAQERVLSEKEYLVKDNSIIFPRLVMAAELTCIVEPEEIDERLRIILLKMVARLFLKREEIDRDYLKPLNTYKEMRL